MNRKNRILQSLAFACLLLSCHSPSGEETQRSKKVRTVTFPISDSIKISDPLNDLYFTVAITPTADKNTYNIHAAYGHNEGDGIMVMPRHSKGLVPALRRMSEPMSFRVGFFAPGDDKFYDYFEVHARNKSIEMKYVKAYSFAP